MNNICHKDKLAIEESGIPKVSEVRHIEVADDYYGTLAGFYETEYSDFAALDPPDDLEDEYNAFLQKDKELVNTTTAIAKKAHTGDKSFINDVDDVAQAE